MAAEDLLMSTKTNKDQSMESKSSKISFTLRPMTLSDVDDFMTWASDDRVFRYTRWDTFTSKNQALDFIKSYAIPHPWFRVICVQNRPIGSVSVMPNAVDGVDRCRAELSLVMAFEYWGKGIATKLVKMVSSMVFKEWPNLERLEAVIYPENKGAELVLEKAGFQREGLMRKFRTYRGKSRDLVVFSLLSSDDQILKMNGGFPISRL